MPELTVELSDLFFDPKNPRLVGFDADLDSQDKMFRYLITDIGVEDLLKSFSASGLFRADPIIVRARPAGGYYVVEGNRRLATLKLLNGIRPDDGLPIPVVPEITADVAATFTKIPVQSDWPEDRLQSYLGYKHVTAAREWPPDAKAKFVYDHAKGDLSETNLKNFARRLGTTFPVLKRWLVAFLTLEQAKSRGDFDPQTAPSRGYFGTFYTLLGGEEAGRFLGLDRAVLGPNPVPVEHLANLAEFVQSTVGTKTVQPKVNSRQQKKLEQVLASPGALEYFRSKGNLDAALLYTEYNAEEISKKLQEAAYSLEDCLRKLADVRDNPAVKSAFAELEGAFRKVRLNMKARAAA